ncbi:MAG: hypothetical protein ACKOXF_07150, partial [Chitinophagaceae bacterium]
MKNSQQHIRHTKAGKTLLSLLWVLPVLLIATIFILPPLPSSPMKRDSFWAHKVNSVDCFDIVYTGDSRVYRGVDPNVIHELTGFKGFNFAFSSADADSLLLSQAASRLSAKGKRILVIGVSVNSFLSRTPNESNAHLKSLIQIPAKDRWIRTNWYPHLSMFDSRAVSDLYKYLKHEHYDEQYHLTTGFAASDKTPSDTTEALPLYKNEFSQFVFSESKLKAFDRCINELKAQGIHVVLVRMPVTHAMQVLEDSKGGLLKQY